MLIKLITKPRKGEKANYNIRTEVFDGVTNYQITHQNGDIKVLSLSFRHNGETLTVNMLDYDQIYVMNNDGTTIETLRNVVSLDLAFKEALGLNKCEK